MGRNSPRPLYKLNDTNTMLNATYTVGSGAYAWTYTRQTDGETKSRYSVAGLALSAARTMSVSKQYTKNNTARHMIETVATNLVPGTTSGATFKDRIYTVVERSPYTSEADIKGLWATHNALTGTAGVQTGVLNGEV